MSNKCKFTTDSFISEAKKIHGDKYDYSKVNYVNHKTKICIICHKLNDDGTEHGETWQLPYSHLNGVGCKVCSHRIQYTTDTYIKRAKEVHGNKFDYSKVKYINKKTKISIKCNKCGNEFEIYPLSHLQGFDCKKCKLLEVSKRLTKTTEQFIEDARKVHGDKYDYSKTIYYTDKQKISIICPIHGIFEQRPSSHLSGYGCKKCFYEKQRYDTEQFNEKIKLIFGDIYDLSKVEYKTTYDKVCVICPIHGEFWKRPIDMIQGHGCPKCNSSSLEQEIRLFLENNNITYEEQKKFNWLKSKQNYFKLDFFLPQYNIAIECHGEQHFKPIEYFGGEETFKLRKKWDEEKLLLCNNNNIKIIYYSNIKISNYKLGDVINNKEKLLNIIYENKC